MTERILQSSTLEARDIPESLRAEVLLALMDTSAAHARDGEDGWCIVYDPSTSRWWWYGCLCPICEKRRTASYDNGVVRPDYVLNVFVRDLVGQEVIDA